MAKLYGEIAAKALLTLDKSFARANGQPLDASEVYYSLEAAKTYAATAQAYIGQKIVVVEDGVVTHYSVEDTAGNLKELGSKPVGDEKTITVAENGTVSLKGVGTLVFERDIVDAETGEPTGDKEAVQYQPLMTAAGLIWVEPSKTTVEGLATLIEAVTGRVNTLENKVGAAAAGETAATGLYALIGAETTRAEAAEKALQDAIKALDDAVKAIDYVDEEEFAEAIKDFTTKTYVDTELGKKVNATDYATDKKALEDEDAAIREIAEAVRDRVDAFLTGEGTAAALDSLQELIAYIDEHDGADLTELFATVNGLEDKLAGIDSTVTAYVTAAIEALNIGDYAKAADLTALAGRVETLEGKVDVEKVSTAIAAAEGRAAADATGKANQALADAKTYANEELAKKVDKVEGYGLLSAEDQAKLDKLTLDDGNLSISGSVEAGSVKNLDTWLTTNRETVPGLYPTADKNKLAGIEAGAEVNVLEGVQVNGADLAIDTNKKVNIDLSAYGAKTAVEKAQADATQALADAAAAQNKANANEGLIGGLDTRVGAVETKTNDNAIAIANHATDFAALKGRVDGHDTTLAGKAEQSVVDTLAGTVNGHTTAIAGINDTIAGINGTLEGKATTAALTAEIERAQAAEKANADAIAAIPNAIATAKQEAIEAATYDDSQVVANKAAIELLNKDASTAGSVAHTADARIAAALAGADADFDTLKEMSDWLATHKGSAAEMNSAIIENANAIKTINETTIPAALAQANSYTDQAIADFTVKSVVAGHDALSITNENGVITVGFASDIILNGGKANG